MAKESEKAKLRRMLQGIIANAEKWKVSPCLHIDGAKAYLASLQAE